VEVLSKGKFIRLSPKKARSVANLVRGKNANVALTALKLTPQKSSHEIAKVLKTAMANAENNFNLEKNDLIVSSIMIDNGPVLKRYRPRAKGAATSIKKRTSHITVIVSGEVLAKQSKKADKIDKTEIKENKIEVERPEFVKKEQAASRVDIKNTIFRRKTG